MVPCISKLVLIISIAVALGDGHCRFSCESCNPDPGCPSCVTDSLDFREACAQHFREGYTQCSLDGNQCIGSKPPADDDDDKPPATKIGIGLVLSLFSAIGLAIFAARKRERAVGKGLLET